MLKMLKCIHMCITEVCLGKAGHILQKTLYKPLFSFWTAIPINCLCTSLCAVYELTFLSIFWKFYSWEKKKKRDK